MTKDIYPDFVAKLTKSPASIAKENEISIIGYHGAEIINLAHACMGLSGELGELIDEIKKGVFGGKCGVDVDKVKKEMGDVLFYFQMLMNVYGLTFEDITELNMKKLSARFPNGWNNEDAINKKDEV